MADKAALSAAKTGAVQPASKPARSGWWTLLIVLGGVVSLLVLAAGYLYFFELSGHSTPTRQPAKVEPTGDLTLDTIRRGVEFLKIHQEADGGFSRGLLDPKPAFTALVVEALSKLPLPYTEKDHEFIRRAAQAIVSKQQPDGSICTPGQQMDNYTTTISVLALKALNNPAYEETLARAKEYLLRIQRPVEDSNPLSGGVGYTLGGRVDGINAAQWVEALKANGVEKDSPAFKNAQLFFSRLQNNKETNDLPAAGYEAGNDGGFIYRPGESKPPDEVSRNGKRIPKSYGLMSYAGLKSFLYMDVSKDDPRVQSAWHWVQDNYTLDENKNIGPDGLYFYYLTMAKALAAYGEPVIGMADGSKHAWARELHDRLLKLQKPDGSWRNDASDRWKEGDAVMVTAFAIRTLAICRDFNSKHPAELRQQAP